MNLALDAFKASEASALSATNLITSSREVIRQAQALLQENERILRRQAAESVQLAHVEALEKAREQLRSLAQHE